MVFRELNDDGHLQIILWKQQTSEKVEGSVTKKGSFKEDLTEILFINDIFCLSYIKKGVYDAVQVR